MFSLFLSDADEIYLISLLPKLIQAGSKIRVKFSSGLKVFEVNKLTSNTVTKQVNDFLESFDFNISQVKP